MEENISFNYHFKQMPEKQTDNFKTVSHQYLVVGKVGRLRRYGIHVASSRRRGWSRRRDR